MATPQRSARPGAAANATDAADAASSPAALARRDLRMGWLSVGMWGGTLVKVWPHLTPFENLNSVAGFVASACSSSAICSANYALCRPPDIPIFTTRLHCPSHQSAVSGLAVVWPTLRLRSYLRTEAMAFLQLFLFVLPFQFSLPVFDAIAPTVATGTLGPVINIFQLFMGAVQERGHAV